MSEDCCNGGRCQKEKKDDAEGICAAVRPLTCDLARTCPQSAHAADALTPCPRSHPCSTLLPTIGGESVAPLPALACAIERRCLFNSSPSRPAQVYAGRALRLKWKMRRRRQMHSLREVSKAMDASLSVANMHCSNI